MSKPTILVVTAYAPSIINFRLGLLKQLIKEGYEIHVLAGDEHLTENILKQMGEQCFHYHRWSIGRATFNPFGDIKAYLELRALMRRLQARKVLAYTLKALLLSALLAKRGTFYALVSGRGRLKSENGLRSKLTHLFLRSALNKAQVSFFQNKEDLDYFKDISSKAVLLPGSGVNLVDFKFQSYPSTIEGFRVLMVSRLIDEKGIHVFRDAAKILLQTQKTPIQFELIGAPEGRYAKMTAELLSQELFPLKYLGHTIGDAKAVIPYYKRSHAVVLPTNYGEGVPRSLIEAMAIGRPIICSKQAGTVGLLDGNGFYLDSVSPSSLAKSIKKLMSLDSASILQMAELSRKRAESHFDEQKVVELMLPHFLFSSHTKNDSEAPH
ncbi:MAG: glycosyltransferase [Cyclobacteriaceae bacterium]|nr:glycosyltransferase [Cyclobacteriaceae bacterium]MCH8515570.1 glycosyltransferase [Cyclobacteriaceae bacterium]